MNNFIAAAQTVKFTNTKIAQFVVPLSNKFGVIGCPLTDDIEDDSNEMHNDGLSASAPEGYEVYSKPSIVQSRRKKGKGSALAAPIPSIPCPPTPTSRRSRRNKLDLKKQFECGCNHEQDPRDEHDLRCKQGELAGHTATLSNRDPCIYRGKAGGLATGARITTSRSQSSTSTPNAPRPSQGPKSIGEQESQKKS